MYSNGKTLHGLYVPDQQLHIPFELYGCLSYFPVRLPTPDEIDTCRWIHMSGDGEWELYSNHFAAAESATRSHLTEHPRYGRVAPATYDADGFEVDGRYQGSVTMVSKPHTLEHVDSYILNAVSTMPTTAGDRTLGATSSKTHRSTVDAAVLAVRWGTSLGTAEQTLRTTTNGDTDTITATWTEGSERDKRNCGATFCEPRYTSTPCFRIQNQSEGTRVRNYS